MTIPEFLAWCEHGEGDWWLSRLRVKWQIQAAAHEQAQADRAAQAVEVQHRAAGWRGGPTAPAGRVRRVA